MRLSDMIEEFIKDLWAKDDAKVELKRNELAQYFRCAPSQINYVLSTRFTPDHGYAIESQRGGGGYIRITRLQKEGHDELKWLLSERLGESITAQEARILCLRLAEQGTITKKAAELLYAAVSPQALSVPIPETLKGAIRAQTLRSMLLCLAQDG
ncbi:MAG TPA: CtsR family transcriptional regulator [Candidatus Limnocylindria bacterium]|nr:CtsR family transcriptional regulator [Candidatus Limnocylindria bacterium]